MDEQREQRQFDVLLWGVTGWTGVHVLEHFAKKYPLNKEENEVTWAVVARDEAKLDKTLKQVSAQFDAEWLLEVKTFIVSNTDEEAVNAAVSQAKVVATVVGPYVKFGETLVKSCVENGTHYCDITGEAHWVRQMIDKYHQQAAENGAYITSFCGNDSIPSDITVFSAIKALDSQIAEEFEVDPKDFKKSFTIEGIVTAMSGNNRGSGGGGGTVASMFEMFETSGLSSLKKYNLLTGDDDECKNDAKHTPQKGFWRNSRMKKFKWTTHYPMASVNEKVVRRSRYLLPEVYGSDLSYRESMGCRFPFSAAGISAVFGIGYPLMSMRPTRNLIGKFLPKSGKLPQPMPAPEKYKPGRFEMTTLAQGDYDLGEKDGKQIQKKLSCTVEFSTPDEIGWTYTAIFLGECAVALAKQEEKIKLESGINGGIVTTACLGNTLIERLKENDVQISVKLGN